jgi:hypothetical protein
MKLIFASALCIILMTTACSMAPSGNSTSTGAVDEELLRQFESTNTNSEVEQRLRRYQTGSSEYLVVIDKNKAFWAIPVDGIKDIASNRVYLKRGTIVGMTTPSGSYDEKEMAKSLIKKLDGSGSESFSFTTDKNGKLVSTGLTMRVGDDVVVVVIKIVTEDY